MFPNLKTTIITVLDVLHSIYVNPNIRIYVGCSGKALSKAIMREVTATLTDPWLQENIWNDRPHIEGRLIPLMDKTAQKRRNYVQNDDLEFSEWDEDMMNQAEQKTDEESNKKVIVEATRNAPIMASLSCIIQAPHLRLQLS